MSKTSKGALIGFLVCGGLGFLVATVVFSQFDNVDVANYAWVGGIEYGLLAGTIGAVIGQVIGSVMAKMADQSVKSEARVERQKFCPNCGSKLPGSAKFCRECGVRMEDYTPRSGARTKG
jgi:ribosomal protein L40E